MHWAVLWWCWAPVKSSTAMERGVIDAFEVSNIALGQEVGYLEAAKYLYFTAGKSNHSMLLINFNLDRWNSFSKDIQQKIAEACHDTVLWSYADNREQDVVAMKLATEKYGVQLKIMPDDVMREFNEAALDPLCQESRKRSRGGSYSRILGKILQRLGARCKVCGLP